MNSFALCGGASRLRIAQLNYFPSDRNEELLLHVKYTQWVCPIQRSTNPPPSPLTRKGKPMQKNQDFFVEQLLNLMFHLRLMQLHFLFSSNVLKFLETVSI